ncbi:MAG: sugar phosphate isomerase/epimerase [Bryobacterales bacterium]|nr:sugar phosphate isomerase/epimerase [Bryobacterales bacterium]
MLLGIGTYCYMWSLGVEGSKPHVPMDPLAILDEAVRLGVDVVQYGPNCPLSPREEVEIAAIARDRGIVLERGSTGLDPQHIGRELEVCERWGSSLLRTVDLYEGTAPGAATFAARLRELLPLLETAGVQLAVENARMPAHVMAEALDSIGSPWLGVTLDTVNSLSIPEGTTEVVRHLAKHTLCLHIKDFRVRRIWHSMGFEVTGTPAGEGQLDVPKLLDQLHRADVNPNAILELWVPQQESVDKTAALERSWVEQSIPYLRSLIPK